MPVALDVLNPESTANALGGELVSTTASLARRLADVAVVDLASLEQAVEDRRQIGDLLKRVEEFFNPFKSMANKLHKALCARESEIKAPLIALDREKANAIRDYKAEDDRRRRAEEQRIAEAQRRQRESEAAAEAAALESSGDSRTAEAVIAEAVAAPLPVVVLADAKKQIDGLKFRRTYRWKFVGGPAEVKDTPPDVLARALALLPREFLMPNEKRINAHARDMQGSAKIPGVEFYFTDDPIR